MPEYSFSVRVLGLDLDDEQHIEQLLDAPFAIVPNQNGDEVELLVSIEADSDRRAWSLFNRYIQDANPNIEIVRIDLDLVNVAEIGERCNVSRETARLWTTGGRREGFPHSYTIAGQSKLWSWSDVFKWVTHNGLDISDSYKDQPLDLAFVEVCNGLHARRERNGLWWRGSLRASDSDAKIITFAPRSVPSRSWADLGAGKFRVKVEASA